MCRSVSAAALRGASASADVPRRCRGLTESVTARAVGFRTTAIGDEVSRARAGSATTAIDDEVRRARSGSATTAIGDEVRRARSDSGSGVVAHLRCAVGWGQRRGLEGCYKLVMKKM